jgi:hypothetical protein
MKLNKRQSKSLKKKLHRGAVALIREKISNKVGCRMIQLIIDGERSDNHGVLEAALIVIEEEKAKRAEFDAKLKIKTKI